MSQKFLFIISSSINHFREYELSRFTSHDRYKQTLETIDTIKQKCPEAKICLFELSEDKIDDSIHNNLKSKVDILLNFSETHSIRELYSDFHKNDLDLFKYGKSLFELKGLFLTLSHLKENDLLSGIDRVFKISGRYLLNQNFNINDYKSRFLKNKYICQHRFFVESEPTTNVHYHVFRNKGSMTTALWSFDANLIDELITNLENTYEYLFRMLLYTPGNDIEHSLFDFIDKSKLINCDVLGVTVRKGMDDDDFKL